VLSYSLSVTPREHFINWHQDPYSNRLARLVFPRKADALRIEVDLVAEMTVINPFDFFVDAEAQKYPFVYDAVLLRELLPYLETLPIGPKLADQVESLRRHGVGTIDYLVELNQRVQRAVGYLIRLEPGIQTPEETLEKRTGSCRDSAWLLVQLLRQLGLAARFVSGFLVQLKPDIPSLDGPNGAEKDFIDLHAWAETYIPGAGWIGLDPTSGLLAGEGHLPLACTADPSAAAAVTGFFSFDDQDVIKADPEDGKPHDNEDSFEYSMSVTRIHEDPRVTKPYSDEQWSAIDALGREIDSELSRSDVRLSMGGEPTFVSIDDMDGAEWNFTAVGPRKYALSCELARRLHKRMAPTGLLHFGQGKWYPGESLPRWAIGLYWRADGQPVWRDATLIAEEPPRGGRAARSPATDEDARHFARELARRLGVEERFVVPGFEDTWYYLWKERRLPVNVDPLDSKLENPEERARLAKVFEQGMDRVVGYALPLRRERFTDGSAGWVSGAWFYRPQRMYLLPGDSPMGLRLPLDSLPWMANPDPMALEPLDPWAPRGPLPEEPALRQRYLSAPPLPRRPMTGPGLAAQFAEQPGPPPIGQSAPWVVKTALCCEVRNGVLRIFMPPQPLLEDYLDLVAAIEATAGGLKMPVLVEGYAPPRDVRLHHLKVTPDPGVIEVNTTPTQTWNELSANTTALYEEARLSRLGTEKFMLDGRHTGTGGGNHIVIGGNTPADSPFLRRPDLLRSLLAYWHNHPSLSYLFSGLFVGPTSQAPRFDEARNDQVYEIELAMRQVYSGAVTPPWLVDRIFRNLLVDSTGNTHRAEFCIDKLFAPETSAGRLGLLEMRAFEMPPHSRMSLTQHLLLRACINWFWKRPYHQKLVRWRTEIHDRFMLPYFVHEDFRDVLDDLKSAGHSFDPAWFEPHFEFRFPRYGAIEQRGIELELRQAIEPWHVLGEEPAGGGAVRYVDSSLERLQVLADGMIDSRHAVAVNGVRVPMHPTGTNGQYVAGVRYRAWQPPNCLHPTIGVHAPLIFDIVDTWSGRSIGGCTYHVAHPGGRNYETFPVNAYEAESRRMARFQKFGHTPGPMRLEEEAVSKEFPFTLDLRRQ
jgi:uncharacterized protein (DUF2126 family)/transglutaminase-like putative cysteine protease